MEKKSDKRYIEAIGRRKTSTARVRITPATKAQMTINGKSVADHFKTKELNMIITDPTTKAKIETHFDISVKVMGGGIHSQAEAVRHGVARALVAFDKELRTTLKKEGFLKRDPRQKERRKFGLKKARKSPQWSKR
ncbi:MAG: 30S ribosomal protein S9 [Candidatus Pacebacteria bacterium]|jgi:small subunit ribosomal protein S9|nr:30S ribosomal protein S9 [Candidatus Paceibacterota bacterium]